MAGQTKADVKALLALAGLKPRHRFGQNFLIDLNLMRKLLAAADAQRTDVLLEVGPGTGSLTELLLETGARVIACEIDRGLAALVAARLGTHGRFQLVPGDALDGKHAISAALLEALRKTPPADGGQYKLVANLPYQIATPLLLELLCVQPRFASLTCTIQKEVGERLIADCGAGDYGPIAVIAQTLADVRIIGRIPPEAFWPQPQVDSVMVQMRVRPAAIVGVADIAGFAGFVREAFGQRRKMMRAFARRAGLPEGTLEEAGVNPEQRPEDLSVEDWRRLFAVQNRPPGS